MMRQRQQWRQKRRKHMSPILHSMKLPNLNVEKNISTSSSDLETLTVATPEVDGNGDSEDDDFQNPSQALALSQSLIHSSLKNSLTQPLKLSNVCHSRKRPRLSMAVGKENESMSKKPCSVSRVFSAAEQKIPAIRKRKALYHKVSSVDVGNGCIATGCSDENVIEDLRSNLSAPEVLVPRENWPYLERTTGNGSQYAVSAKASILKSHVCTENVELGNKSRNLTCLEKSMNTCVTKSADECNDYNETQSRRPCLASTELKLSEDRPTRKTEIPILNHFIDQEMMEDKCELSSESRLLELRDQSVSSECGNYYSLLDGCSELKLRRQFEESKVPEKGPIGGTHFLSTRGCELDVVLPDKKKQNSCATSIESKLLDPSEKLIPCTIRGDSVEVGVSEEFEGGTQLNMLMDLCCEMDDQSCSGRGVASFEPIRLGIDLIAVETNSLVECPSCRTDITKLTEGMRQIHTNDCLDRHNIDEVSIPINKAKLNSCQQLGDTNPVIQWLRALDLCHYEEVFMREEIDWDTLQWLTEEDLISIGVVTLGPRKKIIRALNELRQINSLAPDGESEASNVAANAKKKIALQGNKLITEYFHGPVTNKLRGRTPVKLFHNVEKAINDPVQKRVRSRRDARHGRLRDIPPWCCIAGTPFRVDAFRYLRGDCSHWFLTHFHMDHYQGLTRKFCHGKIYCSKITAHLVNMKIGIPWDRIQILPLNEKITIAGINLTCLDANHCPGSIIILFEPPNDKAILHTGDFRFSEDMAGSALLKSSHVHTLILDTTYCNPQYDFPKQDEVVQFVIDAIQAEAFNPQTLFLIGTYTIGKERIFLEVARTLKKKIYVGAAKLNLLKCLDLPQEDMQLCTENEMESHIHVVPMWTIASFKRMKHISEQYMGRYNLIVAFSPTGWTFGKGKKKTPGRRWQQGTVIRYEVPYSEHCSFTELKDFVRYISPENIIPSVNNDGPESVDAMLALLLSDS